LQVVKHGAKEVSRQQVLAKTPEQTDNTPPNWVALKELVKTKQAAVGKLMLPSKQPAYKATAQVPKKPPAGVPALKKKTNRPAASKPKQGTVSRNPKAKSSPLTAPVLHDITTTSNTSNGQLGPTIQLCGCHHGDLSALKSFTTKAKAAYYTRPNRFLAGMGCLDCKQAVMEMQPAARHQQAAVVFYCDQGIKGHNVPADDKMKAELTCNLVLCPQSKAIRRIDFEKETAGGRSRRRKQSGS
jgi:hypothetical protein